MEQNNEHCLHNNQFVLQAALLQAFRGISEAVSEEEFQGILTILQSKKSTIRKLSKVFVSELFRKLNAALENMLEEGTLTEGLAKVSKLTEEATLPVDFEAWRPPGDVKLHMRSHEAEKIQHECEILEKQLLDIEAENASKMEELSERRKKLQATQEQTTRLLNKTKIVLPRMEKIMELLEECIKDINCSELNLT